MAADLLTANAAITIIHSLRGIHYCFFPPSSPSQLDTHAMRSTGSISLPLLINTSKKFTATLSSPINTHSIAVKYQHRNCNAVVPDPIFPAPTQKKKIVVWLRETSQRPCKNQAVVWLQFKFKAKSCIVRSKSNSAERFSQKPNDLRYIKDHWVSAVES